MMKFRIHRSIAASALLITGATLAAQNQTTVLPVQGKVSLVTIGGTNVTVQTGKNGVVLVDTPPPAMVPELMTEIRKLTPQINIRYIINTSLDPEYISGNAAL